MPNEEPHPLGDAVESRLALPLPPERDALLNAAHELSQLPLFIDDTPARTVGQIGAICRRMKRRNNIGLVIIDYLQLVEPEDKKANREQQIAQTTRRLKGIAKENDIPVVAQLPVPLTTVRSPAHDIGVAAVRRLLDLVRDGDAESMRLPVELVVRASS